MSSNNPPHPITLFCWILDVSDRSFSVTIQTTRTVDQLKEEIVKKKPNAFVNVDPDQLDLWKVSIAINQSLTNEVAKRNITNQSPLSEADPMSDVFPHEQAKKTLHIVIRAPSVASNVKALSQDFSHLTVDDPDISIENINLPRVSPERDTITDNDHKALDYTILTTFSANRQINQIPHLPLLLWNITNHDKRLNSLTMDEASNLLKIEPLIKTILSSAWRAGAFRQVRQLAILWPNVEEQPLIISDEAVEAQYQQAERLNQMFHQTFQGKADDDFRAGLDVYREIYDDRVYFGRWISLLQSSGTGKSRLVEQLGRLVPTLSICLRSDPSPRAGWPPGDQPAVQFFKNNDYLGEELAAAFLGALMSVVADKLKARATSNTLEASTGWDEGLMTDWELDNAIDVAQSSRYGSFAKVERLADEYLKTGKEAIQGLRLPSSRPHDYTRSVVDWHCDLFSHFCLSSYQRFAGVLRELGQEYFVFAFDECTQLGNPAKLSADRIPQVGMTLIALQRIIKSFDAYPAEDITLWFLLLDTTSSIPDLLPQGPDAPSIRLTEGFIPLPPWPYVGFNQVVPKDHIVRIQKPSDALHLGHVKVYGRPMWHLYSDFEVLKAAVEKLFFNRPFNPKDVNQVFAAFATRIGLEIGEGEASARLAIDAVRSYMRILIGVSGRLVITASPSEPMLAIAAALSLNWTTDTYKEALKTLINELILRGLILDRGLQGELYCRLLLMLARDKAVLPHGGRFVKVYGNEHKILPARLSQFFQVLLGPDLGIPGSDGEQPKLRNRFLQEMSNVWINFTHFIQLSEPISEVTEAILRAAWSGGYAFQCAFHQPVIDGFFVAYRGDLDKPFNSAGLFLAPWQSKAKSEAADLALALHLTAPFIIDDKLVRHKPEHVVLLMDLGASSAFGHAKGVRCQLSYGDATRPMAKSANKAAKGGKWDGYARGTEKEGARYCINIRGHSRREYPVIADFEGQFDQLFQRSLKCTRLEYERFQEGFLRALDPLNLSA